jgi:ATP-dependent Clp protease ATP-binding subunit ClpA
VVLFDEVEKAHAEVLNVLLQLLDDGRLTDGQGRTVDFKNVLVVMTSNLGSQWILDYSERERSDLERRVHEALRAHFRPEFLNRIDEVVIFHALSKEQLTRIVDLNVKRLRALLAGRDLGLVLTPAARAELAEEGYDPVFGARPLKRTVQRRIQNPLAMKLLAGDFRPGQTVEVDFRDGGFTFRAVEAGVALPT